MASEKLGDSSLLIQDREAPTWFRLVVVVRRGFIPWPTINLGAKTFDFARNFWLNAAAKVGAFPIAPGTVDGAVMVMDMRPSTTQSVIEFKRRIVRGFADWDVTADNIEVFRITSGDLDEVRSPAARVAIAEAAEEVEAGNRLTGRVARGLSVGLKSARMLVVGAFVLAALVVLLPLVRPKLFGKLVDKFPGR